MTLIVWKHYTFYNNGNTNFMSILTSHINNESSCSFVQDFDRLTNLWLVIYETRKLLNNWLLSDANKKCSKLFCIEVATSKKTDDFFHSRLIRRFKEILLCLLLLFNLPTISHLFEQCYPASIRIKKDCMPLLSIFEN